MDFDMSGKENIIKTQKMVENIDNKFYIKNKVVEQDLKMTKIWSKIVRKSLSDDQERDINHGSQK